jgi:large subunit ribosomal protein L3e
MGGFVRYGVVNQDFMMIKGSCPGSVKRPITLRKTLIITTDSRSSEEVSLKWIDTSSKFGHGRFQTAEEKIIFNGPMKKDKNKN